MDREPVDWVLQGKRLDEAMLDIRQLLEAFKEEHNDFQWYEMKSSYPPRMLLTVYLAGTATTLHNYSDMGFEYAVDETSTVSRELEDLGVRIGKIYDKHLLAGKIYHSGGKVQYKFWPKIK